MDAFAEPEDIVAIYKALTAEQAAAAPGLLAQASTKVRAWGREHGYNIDAMFVADQLHEEIIKGAVANAAKRALQNIEGIYETSFAIDDYRETNRRDQALSTGAVYIDEADLAGLIPRKRSGLRTIRLGSAL